MTDEKQFTYTAGSQRKLLYILTSLLFITSGFILSNTVIDLKYYLFYQDVYRTITILAAGGICIGSVLSYYWYTHLSSWKLLLKTGGILYALLSGIFILKDFIQSVDATSFYSLLTGYYYSIHITVFLIFACKAILLTYLLKTACGTFIDEKNALHSIIITAALSLSFGILCSSIKLLPFAMTYTTAVSITMAIVSFCVLIPVIKLDLDVNPTPFTAKQFKEEAETDITPVKTIKRDDLLFNYLNFALIAIFSYLCHATVIKFYGNTFTVKLFLTAITGLGLCAGYCLGLTIKRVFWHIYSEMLFPLVAIAYILFIFQFNISLPYYIAASAFLPTAMFFGFSLKVTIDNILQQKTQQQRFTVLFIALFILPFPLIWALQQLEFTYFWFFTLLYGLSFFTIVLPGLYLQGKKIQSLKKTIYFLVTLLFIPGMIFLHLFSSFPYNSELFSPHTRNFKVIKNINYNSPYVKYNDNVYINNVKTFHISDSSIRNLKRALAPLLLYTQDKNAVCFLDGNQKFMRNPIIGLFNNLICIDTVPARVVDYNRLPLSGEQKYFAEEHDALKFLSQNRQSFKLLVDIPNIQDQHKNTFRFSKEYYKICKKNLSPEGIFTQIYNLDDINPFIFSTALKTLEKLYAKRSIYLFSNVLVLLSTDSEIALDLHYSAYKRIEELIPAKTETKFLFVDAPHLLSNHLTNDLEIILTNSPDERSGNIDISKTTAKSMLEEELIKRYINRNNTILKDIPNTKKENQFKLFLRKTLNRNNAVLTLLKKSALAEHNKEYELETETLFTLKKYTGYKTGLKLYLNHILSYKEEYYYQAALELEKQKKWENAQKLYKAILTINSNNFNANYRMGLVSIILQDLNDAFIYLQKALKIKKRDPHALYQMGVLLFSRNRHREAIRYLNMARDQRLKNASIFLYLGLAHEELNELNTAKNFYTSALIEDPNDTNIKRRLEKLKKIKESERKKWQAPERKSNIEEEQGETIPIPINKSAYEIRIPEKELKDKKYQKSN